MADLEKIIDADCYCIGTDAASRDDFLSVLARLPMAGEKDAPDEALAQLIEAEVIPRLMLAHRNDAPGPVRRKRKSQSISPHELAQFCDLLQGVDVAAVHGFVASLRSAGANVESIMLDLLAPAARFLGILWERDEADFAGVTLGLYRLQIILRSLTGESQELSFSGKAHRALFAPAPGEQHNFGVLILDEFFHRAGWDVWTTPSATPDAIVQMVGRESFEIAGLSISCDAFLGELESLISEIRRVSRNRSIVVMVGGRIFLERPELVTLLGADGMATDGRQAVKLAEMLLPTSRDGKQGHQALGNHT